MLRFATIVFIVPGRRRNGGRPRVMAVIDTSGSISSDLLDLINGELARMAVLQLVTVVECDAEIQRVYRWHPLQYVLGRGGTDFRPPLEAEFLAAHRTDVVVYFTDGHGPAPKIHQEFPFFGASHLG